MRTMLLSFLACLVSVANFGCSAGADTGNTSNAVSEIQKSAGHSTVQVNPNLPKPMGAGGGGAALQPGINPKFRH